MVVEIDYNLLENNHDCMVALHGQTLLHRSIIDISLKKFHGYSSL